MVQSHVARPSQVRRPITGAVGLVLILAYPLANMIVGMGVVLVPAPQVLTVTGAVVLLVGTALVAHAGLPQHARRWIVLATALAGLTGLAALLPITDVGLSPVRIALAGASLATLSWGMRRWMLAIGHSRGVVWWTAKAVLEVLAAGSMTLVGPLNVDPTGGTGFALMMAFLVAVVALTRLGVHVGAIITGLQAFTRADAADARGGAPAPPTAADPAAVSVPGPGHGSAPRVTGGSAPRVAGGSSRPAASHAVRHASSSSSGVNHLRGGLSRRRHDGEITWAPPTRTPQP